MDKVTRGRLVQLQRDLEMFAGEESPWGGEELSSYAAGWHDGSTKAYGLAAKWLGYILEDIPADEKVEA